MPPIALGQRFNSLQGFKDALRQWAIEDNFTPAILDSDSRRVRVGCRASKECSFRLRCNFSEKTGATVTTFQDQHSCPLTGGQETPRVSRSETSKLRFLLEAVPRLLHVDQSTPTKAIVDAVKQKYGQEIALRQAQKVKTYLCPKHAGPLDPRVIEDLPDVSVAPRAVVGRDVARQCPEDRMVDGEMDLDLHDVHRESMGNASLPALRTSHERSRLADSLPSNSNSDTNRNQRLPTMNMDGQLNLLPPHLTAFNSTLASSTLGNNGFMGSGKTAQEIRNEAAVLFQRASEKFQEASFLHAEASRLFASVANA